MYYWIDPRRFRLTLINPDMDDFNDLLKVFIIRVDLTSMLIQTLLNHHQWANNIYFAYLKELSPEQMETKLPGSQKSCKDIIAHLYEVYWNWYAFLTDKNYKEHGDFEKMPLDGLISGIQTFQVDLVSFCQSHDLTKSIAFDEDEDGMVIQTTPENVIYNYFLHAAYHRGQLALLLRYLGFESIEETDFNPYLYQMATKELSTQ